MLPSLWPNGIGPSAVAGHMQHEHALHFGSMAKIQAGAECKTMEKGRYLPTTDSWLVLLSMAGYLWYP